MRNHENIDPFLTDPANIDDRDYYIFINNPYLISTRAKLTDFGFEETDEL